MRPFRKKLFDDWIAPVVRLADRMARVLLLAMMGMTTADVLMRKFTSHSILGTVELTEMMMAAVVFGALAQCEADDGHIRIDFVLRNAPQRIRSLLDALTQGLGALLFGTMAWALGRHAAGMAEWGEVTLDLGLPLYPVVCLAAAGCGLLALVLCFKCLAAVGDAQSR